MDHDRPSRWRSWLTLALTATGLKKPVAAEDLPSFYTLKGTTIDGEAIDFSVFAGKVALVVNVASRCGFTDQYKGLEGVYQKYKDRGFVVLGFPSNDFGGQEPGTDGEIKQFCSLNYQVSFPLFSKGPVTGEHIQEVYKYLSLDAGPGMGGPVLWNFEKFLIDRQGRPIDRFRSPISPSNAKVTAAIEAAL